MSVHYSINKPKPTWLACHSSILKVIAVMGGSVRTVNQSSLSASAPHIIQYNWISALTKECKWSCSGILIREPSLSAHNSSIIVVPEIITNSPPSIVHTNFYSAFILCGTIYKSDISVYTHCKELALVHKYATTIQMKITNLDSQLRHLQSESNHEHQLDWQGNLRALLHYQCNQPGQGRWVHYPAQTEQNYRLWHLFGKKCVQMVPNRWIETEDLRQKFSIWTMNSLISAYPSCLQTTVASLTPQASSHTVPQVPLWQNSTRPSLSVLPPTSLTSPDVQFPALAKKMVSTLAS